MTKNVLETHDVVTLEAMANMLLLAGRDRAADSILFAIDVFNGCEDDTSEISTDDIVADTVSPDVDLELERILTGLDDIYQDDFQH